jgi:hypothetical protein
MDSTPPILAYASTSSACVRPGLYRTAMFFILAPLVIGLGCLAGFAISHHPGFALAGLFTLLGGVLSVIIASVCLWAYVREARRSPAADQALLTRQRARAVALIILDVVAAGICTAAGIALVRIFLLPHGD